MLGLIGISGTTRAGYTYPSGITEAITTGARLGWGIGIASTTAGNTHPC